MKDLENLLQENREARLELERSAKRLQASSMALQSAVKRDPSTLVYVKLAQTGVRVSEEVLQGVRRTASVDRVVIASVLRESEAIEEEKKAADAKKKRAENKAKIQGPSTLSVEDADLVALYGRGNT